MKKWISETAYYQRNRELILNRAKEYHENNEEVLKEKEGHKYRELSEKRENMEEIGIKICLKKLNKD